VRPADDPKALSASCYVTAESTSGCPLSPAAAAASLGFEVRVPDGVPEGWVLERANLRVFTDAEPPPQGLPQGSAPVFLYNQVWTPPGVDLNAQASCGPYVAVRERMPLGGEATSTGGTVHVGAGHLATGHLSTAACGTNGPVADISSLSWVDGGVWISVNGWGIDNDAVVVMARSLNTATP